MKTRLLLFMFMAFSFAKAQTISTRAGSTSGYVEGTGTAALFNRPSGIAIDGGSAVVVTDQNNNRVRKIYSDNSTGFWAGSSTSGAIINGTGAAARFNSLTGVARDGFNNAYVCDSGNHAIRKITSAGVVTTFAGGTLGTADGTGTAAQFQNPQGLAIDASGNLYVSDTNNHRIRKITPAGVVTTLAGSTNGFVNGTGTAAQFSYPFGIAVDASGNVFVGENCRIRKITPAGVVTTFAGSTIGYLDGNGTAAQFNNGILGITIGSSGDLYVADSYNYRIRKITSAGVVTTYAGLGYSGTTDGDVSVASFNVITGIAINTTNNTLYIVDHFNNRIRAIAPSLKPDILSPTVFPNPNYATIKFSLNAKNFATTSVVKYGLASNSLISQVTGFNATGTSNVNGNVILPALNPGTTYYYQIEATNSQGTTVNSIGSFVTPIVTPPIAEYTFNNTYNNINGNTGFVNTGATSFITDRNGVANNALQITGGAGTQAGITAPLGNASRTVSLWYRVNVLSSTSGLFYYGTGANGIFGSYITMFGANAYHTFQNGQSDYISTALYSANNWRHLVITYDGINVSIYVNGAFIGNSPYNLATTASNFVLGSSNISATLAIDDLKIFNYVLPTNDITSLYVYNTLSSPDFSQNNLKVAVYPNPVSDILNIETETEIKSVEIYNLQGQKIKTALSKQINVSDLASGIYMVRIEDTNNAVETKKIVKQ
ncbi:Por secretion system C-terminal sorting domain-containing protein [Flavobacterium swingsii]|uniref:Por secretion system C-terminal sorting domain-containing protein n=1 Tax=Flavobacterium swingsii TaxID=498292 RepID=A0A1I0XVC3_9FLAO|nr:T9SS type A sorting domain-containing protein [Flavobacterium swingsii]SFB04250.1 Por secretion system C-terminal sorting domain-containing protein [Flavobacterium swingsii]